MRKLFHVIPAATRHVLIGVLATAALLAAYAIAGDEREPALGPTSPIQEQLEALCAASWPDDEMHAEARRRACAKD